MRWMTWLVATIAIAVPPVAGAEEESESSLTLPADLQWCETLDSVAVKLGIDDTSEFGDAYRSDGEYLVTGSMWGQQGNYTVRFETYGGTWYLIEAEFRMFRLESAWVDFVERLGKLLGPGTSEVVASAVSGPDGEELKAQRSRHKYADPNGKWAVLARQMSNEIDAVKFTYGEGLCQPEGWEPGSGNSYDVAAPPKAERREDSIFEYDMWADDPLHGDTREQEIEDEKKKKEEEQEEEKDPGDIDWESLDGEDTEVEW